MGAKPEVLDLSIFVHVTDSEAKIRALGETYRKAMETLEIRGEVLFILDGVGGRILEECEALEASHQAFRVLVLQGKGNGESIAYAAARDHSQGRYIVTSPDYLQIDPAAIGSFLGLLESQADFVCSWRHPRVDPLLNRLQSRFFNWFLRRLSQNGLHDLNCTFRGMKREVLEEIPIYGDQFRFLPILAERQGFRVTEVSVRHLEERGKTGFFGIGVYLRRLLDILAVTFLTRFTSKPIRFFGSLGLVLILFGLLLGVPPVYEKVFHGSSIQDRPIFLMGIVLVTFGLQLIGFGLVGEVIIFTRARNLRDYKVQRILSSGVPNPPPSELETGEGECEVDLVSLERSEIKEAGVSPLIIRHAAPGEDLVLDRFVREHPQGTLFHTSSWRRMVEDVLESPGEVLVAEKGHQILGVLSFFEIKSPFLGHVAVSMPFGVYGGVLARGTEAARGLVARAADLSGSHRNRYLELRQKDPLDLNGVETNRYVTFRRELPEDPAECLGMIPRKARAEIRKARDEGNFRFSERRDLKLFHSLFATNKQELGSPSIPFSMLAALERNLGPKMVMHCVDRPDGQTIATVLSFIHGDCLMPYYSGALSTREGRGANNYMYWRLMEWASAKGFKIFDFGRSRKDSGAAKFKKNMGFQPEPLHYQYFLGEKGKLPDFHPDNPKLGVYQRIWKKLPGFLVRPLGGWIFKRLP